MTDRENVIKGLREISEYTRAKADIAGVGKGKELFDCWYRAAEDALELLKEMEEENIMTETEKIIKGLQCCGQESEYGCDDCPYNVDPDDFTTCRQLYTDAVKQLKQLDALVKALELEKKEEEANE